MTRNQKLKQERRSKITYIVFYSVFHSGEVQKLWVLGKRQEAKGKREEK
ncbi:hypothetical protein [Microcystis aeruginosa]|nr:hypothetical protein [Microcystis aeruginosa]